MRLLRGGRKWPWDNKSDGEVQLAKRRFSQQHCFLKGKRLCQDLRDKKRSAASPSWSSASFFRQSVEERISSSELKKEHIHIRKNTDA